MSTVNFKNNNNQTIDETVLECEQKIRLSLFRLKKNYEPCNFDTAMNFVDHFKNRFIKVFDDFVAEAYPNQVNNDYRVNNVAQKSFSSIHPTINPIKREYNGCAVKRAQSDSEDDANCSIWILDSDDDIPTVRENSHQRDEQPSTSKSIRLAGSKVNDLNFGKVRNQSNAESAVNVMTGSFCKTKSEKCPASVQRPQKVGPFKCEVCSQIFPLNQKLIFHRRLHLKSSSIHCRVCLHQFLKLDESKNHEKNCNLLRYECFLCRSSKLCKASLEMHMLKHSNKRAFQCNRCLKKFKHNSSLHYHGKFACWAKK